MATKQNTNAPATQTVYRSVGHHVYHDGYSYRVRVSINGTRFSQNFSSKKKAFAYRSMLLKSTQA